MLTDSRIGVFHKEYMAFHRNSGYYKFELTQLTNALDQLMDRYRSVMNPGKDTNRKRGMLKTDLVEVEAAMTEMSAAIYTLTNRVVRVFLCNDKGADVLTEAMANQLIDEYHQRWKTLWDLWDGIRWRFVFDPDSRRIICYSLIQVINHASRMCEMLYAITGNPCKLPRKDVMPEVETDYIIGVTIDSEPCYQVFDSAGMKKRTIKPISRENLFTDRLAYDQENVNLRRTVMVERLWSYSHRVEDDPSSIIGLYGELYESGYVLSQYVYPGPGFQYAYKLKRT